MNNTNFNLNNLNGPAKLILGGNLLAIIACFLPFASLSFFGISGSLSLFSANSDGKLVLILGIVGIAMTFFKPKFAFIANIVSLFFTFTNISESMAVSGASLNIGAYLLVIANIVAIVGSVKSKNA